jgi:nitroreductase
MFVTLDLRAHAEELVDKARMAPSLHNAQPWAFRVKWNAVEVYADRSRAIPVLDPDDRQLLIGVGGAVFGVRLGVSVLGAEPSLALLPGAERGDLAALVTVGPEHRPTIAEERLAEQLPLRRTIRERMDPQMPEPVRAGLTAAASLEAATLNWVGDPEARRTLVHLVTLAERREQADPRIRAELARWVGGDAPRYGSGIPAEAFRLDPVEPEPTVAVLTTDGDRPADWLRAGQALQRVLLTATMDGLGASYVNQPLELPDLRSRVRDELALPGFPQLILRFGRPVEGWPAPTPRRPVRDILRP